MKRVYCLYRVSTLGQVEKDDIPMQRQACHAFAEKQGWQIIAEFSEKGVSGFKQSAEQREALVAIKQAAILKKFDVLLVFMFDRLGRRDDETPFVVEWFVKNGIAVWSVMEGEQRFENHVDKLLNYIRFWQSSGESIKTALRTRVRMEQLIQENGYVGGTAPYGYRLCKLGRVNKRGFEVHDLLMDPAKAEVIKTIFRLYCEEDMGPYRIAVHLTQQGELTRRGTQWNAASVRNILGNAIYTGIRTYGAIQTERFSHLQIVSDELYLCAQQKLQACRLEEPRPLRSQHWDAVLLKDRPYCMHCGKPVTVSRNRKSRRKRDGTVAVYDRMKYICINKNAFEPCTGQRNYSTRRIDQLILEAVGRMLFSDAFKIPSMDENSALSRCWQLAQELVYGIGSSSGSIYPDGTSNDYPLQWGGPSVTPVTAFTPVSDVEQANGSIGTLSIPSLGIRYRVYDGTSSASMRKGVGHFPSTSAWSGNIGLCGHNRGSSHNIGSIKNLEVGDAIRYETSLGTRTYSVSYVGIIDWTDWSYLNATSDNRITLITCLADQPTKRVCVQGIEVSS